MVEPAFGTLLIAAVGRPVLQAPGFAAARRAAIALPAIAICTNPEQCLASLATANALPENQLSMNRHPPMQADFDNGNGSCQGRTSLDGDLLMKVGELEPAASNSGFSAAFQATIHVFTGHSTEVARERQIRMTLEAQLQHVVTDEHPWIR